MASWKWPRAGGGNCAVLKPARLPRFVPPANGNRRLITPPRVVNVVNGAGGEIGENPVTSKPIPQVASTAQRKWANKLRNMRPKHYSGDAGAGRHIAKYLLCRRDG
ncbi:hypothetical protein ACNKHS_21390 [Shigella flexneri]